jgi:serine/threonine protein kinase
LEPLVDYDLGALVKNKPDRYLDQLSEFELCTITADIFAGLTYIYAQSNGVHRDMKPTIVGVIRRINRLIQAVILDPGCYTDESESNNHDSGTVLYLAPEQIKLKRYALTSGDSNAGFSALLG